MSPRQRRWTRIARWAGIAAVIWLAGVNVVINSRLLPRALSSGERVVEWDFAWTILPNRVHVSGFHMEDRTRSLHWRLDVDDASFWLDLGALLDRQFHVTSLDVRGARFDVSKREDPAESSERDRDKKRWQVWLEWVDIAGARSLCVLGTCLRGDARVRGGFRLQPLEWFEVGPAALYVDGDRVEIDGATAADELDGVLRVELSRVEVAETEGIQHLRHANVESDLSATIPSFSTLAGALGASEPSGGHGSMRLRLHVREGRLTDRTAIDARVEELLFTLDEHVAVLGGPIHGEVRDESLHVVLEPATLTVRTTDADEPQLETDSLRVRWSGLGADLAAPAVDAVLRFRVPTGRVDAPLFAPFLPRVLEPRAGRGSFSASGRWDVASKSYDVRLRSTIRGVAVTVEPAELRTRVEVDARVRKRGWRKDLDGTRIELVDLSVRESEEDARGWRGVILFGPALDRREDEKIANRVQIRARDAGPILALLEASEDPPDIAQRLLEMEGLTGTADAYLGGGDAAFREIHLSGDGLEIEGWIEMQQSGARYSLTFDAGLLSLGIERDGDGVSFHPLGIGM